MRSSFTVTEFDGSQSNVPFFVGWTRLDFPSWSWTQGNLGVVSQ